MYSDENSLVLEITVCDGELVGERHDERENEDSTSVKERMKKEK